MTRYIVVVLSLLVSGALFAQSQQQIRDQLFGETDAVKKQAEDLNAKVLAPESYAEGMEVYMSAVDTMEKGKDLDQRARGARRGERLLPDGRRRLAAREDDVRGRVGGAWCSRESGIREVRRARLAACRGGADGARPRRSKAATSTRRPKRRGDAQERYRETETKAIAAKARAAQ